MNRTISRTKGDTVFFFFARRKRRGSLVLGLFPSKEKQEEEAFVCVGCKGNCNNDRRVEYEG